MKDFGPASFGEIYAGNYDQEHDPVTQTVQYQRMKISAAGVEMQPLPIRYAWPAEIDLMARLAGLRLQSRWGGWDRSPFTAESRMHVSVYEKAA